VPSIELKNITNHALLDFNLKIQDGELLALLGPNGAGKTTLLNVIAGLTDYRGSVLFDGKPIDDMPTQQRKVGYIFQRPLLFPHLDVESNVSYGIQAQGVEDGEVRARTDGLLTGMDIAHLKDRYPATLSGGEQQRVSLARTLACNPKVMLFDEPFNGLDFNTRRHLRLELKHLHKKYGTTTIFVTHDLREAEKVGDRIAVINRGKIHQVGPPDEVFFTPGDQTVFDFIGRPNILTCDGFREAGMGLAEVRCGDISLIVPHDGNIIKKLVILQSDILVSPLEPEGPRLNCFKGVVTNITKSNGSARIDVMVGTISLQSLMFRDEFESLKIPRLQRRREQVRRQENWRTFPVRMNFSGTGSWSL